MSRYWSLVVAVSLILFYSIAVRQWRSIKTLWQVANDIPVWVREMYGKGWKPYRIRELVLKKAEASLPETTRGEDTRLLIQSTIEKELWRLQNGTPNINQ